MDGGKGRGLMCKKCENYWHVGCLKKGTNIEVDEEGEWMCPKCLIEEQVIFSFCLFVKILCVWKYENCSTTHPPHRKKTIPVKNVAKEENYYVVTPVLEYFIFLVMILL